MQSALYIIFKGKTISVDACVFPMSVMRTEYTKQIIELSCKCRNKKIVSSPG